jgi:hypothetical protein
MHFREIIVNYSENDTKPINKLHSVGKMQTTVLLNVKAGSRLHIVNTVL